MQPTWQGCPAHRFVAFAAVLLAAASAASPARAQLRIVTYNTNNVSSSSSGPRADAATVFTALGDQAKAGFARPADIVLFQEHAAVATSTQAYVNLLNGIYGAGTYARGSLDGATSGGGRPTVVYKTSAVTLVGETAVNSTSTSGAARATLRYQFRPVGYDSAADFYVYNSHFKASNDSTSRARRGVEADGIRANADALGAGVAAIYAGDFNFYRSSEAGFGNFTAAGHGQAFDPINRVGSWTNSSSFLDVHTQSPVTASQFNGQITGGMDDRFDFQLVTGAVLDGRGFDYLPGSYWAFGNTGTHTLDGALSTGSAAALQALLPGYTSQQATAVINALMSSTDHLPVVADYQLPARLGVAAATLPGTVLRGANVSGNLAVSNSAPVAVAIGADRLDYTVSGSGGLTASGSGSLAPLAAAASHALSLDTSSAGLRQGTLTVSTTSPQAAGASFTRAYSVNVLDTAAVAKTGPAGAVAAGGSLAVTNAAAAGGTQRAAAVVASRTLAGDSGWSVSGLGVGTSVAAGGVGSGTAAFDAAGRLNGTYSASFTLGLQHDQSLPGAAAGDLGTLAWNLETTVAGRTGSGMAAVGGGESYAGLGIASGLARGTAATVLGGTAGEATSVSLSFAAAPEGDFFSDVLTLGGTSGDAIVLSLTYDAGSLGELLPGDLFLGWLDTRPGSDSAGEWVNSVLGNSVNLVAQETAYLGSWESYLADFSPASPAAALGAWGVDSSAASMWAVVDHNSEFAIVAVPEPGTWLLLAAAGAGTAWRRLRSQA
jgi:hypothetical protein